MALNTNEQLTLAEAAIAINNGPAEEVQESTEETTEISEMDMVALSFIQSALGEDIINESTEEDYAVAVSELVESLNQICFAVNDYFGLYND
ncbi:MAG TPA: hypothetical protein DF712_12920 [Balneola sp.]|nr:hypothetical protein [Balneola sp.]|tara:strand:- start:1952 stop:2227 length:276 start_codon:yes stop_codon:yes gene_type:complete